MKNLSAKMLIAMLSIMAIFACNTPSIKDQPAYTEEKLMAIRDSFDIRVAQIFESSRGKALKRSPIRPPLEAHWPGRPYFTRNYSFSLVGYASRCFWNNEQIDSANAALAENSDYYLGHHAELVDRDNTHWNSEMLLRLIEFYGSEGSLSPGLMTLETENKILEHLWIYSKRIETGARAASVPSADHKTTGTWAVMESENHHSQSFTTMWHFAKLAKNRSGFRDRIYDDGFKAADHYARWTEYTHMYLAERARKGMFIEMMSVGYNQHLLKGIFNVYDFAEDPGLKAQAKKLIDIYFAYWGQEQIEGIAGGGKSRIYSDINPKPAPLGYLFFGVGHSPGMDPTLISAMTTDYRPPLVLVDIVKDTKGRGSYEVIQRPQGLVDTTKPMYPLYPLRTDSGGIIRYSYCTPDFIIGTPMVPSKPSREWALISSQNRSHGVLFAGEPISLILPQCENPVHSRAYNSQWSVQRKGTLICQKLKHHQSAGETRIWFSKFGLSEPLVEDDWVFTEAAGAYAALHVVEGSFSWDPEKNIDMGKWLYCEKDYSPVILEVHKKSEFDSFADFRERIKEQEVELRESVLNYKSLYGDSFTFFADHSNPPRINNVTVDYAPENGFESPFLHSVWNSGIVTIQKGNRKLVHDFN